MNDQMARGFAEHMTDLHRSKVEIVGMQAENTQCVLNGHKLKYVKADFDKVYIPDASHLRDYL